MTSCDTWEKNIQIFSPSRIDADFFALHLMLEYTVMHFVSIDSRLAPATSASISSTISYNIIDLAHKRPIVTGSDPRTCVSSEMLSFREKDSVFFKNDVKWRAKVGREVFPI